MNYEETVEAFIRASKETADLNYERFHDLDVLEIGALLHVIGDEDTDRLPLVIGAMSFINLDALAEQMLMTTGLWLHVCSRYGCSLEEAIGNRKVMEATLSGITLVCLILMSRQIVHPVWIIVAQQVQDAQKMPSKQSDKSLEQRAALIEAWYNKHKDDRAGVVTCASDLVLAEDLNLPVGEVKSSCEMLCEHGKLVRNRNLSERPMYHPPMEDIREFSVVIGKELSGLIDNMRKNMDPSESVFPQYESLERKLNRPTADEKQDKNTENSKDGSDVKQ